MSFIGSGFISSGVMPGYREYTFGGEYYYSGSPTTWTMTATNVSYLTIEAWGGGGGGGAAPAYENDTRGGGGGGAYAKTTYYNPTDGTELDLTVGIGGDGSLPVPESGGTTTVDIGAVTLVKAVGGQPGTNSSLVGGNGGVASGCIGNVRYSGGDGGNGIAFAGAGTPADYYSGPGGGGAGSEGNGGDGANVVFAVNPAEGVGTSELGGNGGDGRNAGNSNGFPGDAYGGGGGGATAFASGTARDGGNGGGGLIRIRWYY